ncbi:hypothetical protein HJC23_008847 [Cyclotella cryptica]|uniref:Uncharacterized protein n=1 Tax=Cyclotella cryptica TaxID=29204 RepID=A0ABD3QA68_9STRA|eukprot:CCRYP_007514-RA/>CCRYP_007514-RA protein AED:0.09 eAED:0.09 QI:0/-1/0/1/-1/1/1/0/387
MISSLFSRKRRHDVCPTENAPNGAVSPLTDADGNSSSCPSSNSSRKKSRTVALIDRDPFDVNLSQREAALALSQVYLRSARSAADRSRRRSNEAREQCSQRQAECQRAERWHEAVQERWGVISIDHDDSHDNIHGDHAPDERSQEQTFVAGSDCDGEDDVPLGKAVSDDCEGGHTDKLAPLLSNSDGGHLDTITNETRHMKQIQISDAGDKIVNGTYQQCLMYRRNSSHHRVSSDNNIQARHGRLVTPDSIYVHTSGPFLLPQNHVSNIYYDLCLYKKWGYGDKIRWCIGLVPCTVNHDHHEDESVATWNTPREWNFDRSYIYYWMEVSVLSACSANSTRITIEEHAATVPLGGKQDWSACHGIRPVPCLREVEQHRWWQRWRSIWE